MVDEGLTVLPFTIAAALQLGSVLWYGHVYRKRSLSSQKKTGRERRMPYRPG
ncbi:hypothetical protein LJK88_40685 [Paenibacillus sp. P26]|nr:hypothetical protein LJK88_40685 [Paenibacillus sp. P26]